MSAAEGWAWQSTPRGCYLTCDGLAGFQHGFFTRSFAPDSLAELTTYLSPLAQPYRLKQVHGNGILTTAQMRPQNIPGSEDGFPLPGDALISTQPHESLWVCSADCVPVLVADVKTGRVAAIHAGWRGTALSITPLTIQKMQAAGSALADLRIALGPAISGVNYQVGIEVAVSVAKTIMAQDLRDSLTPTEILEMLQAWPNSPLIPDPAPERVRLDLRRVNGIQLENLGLTSAQIAIAPYCTFAQSEQFFSYRRERLKQVQWSGIVSQP